MIICSIHSFSNRYDDGKDFQHDSALVALIIKLLSFNLNVAVVTAAGYTENAEARYEGRLSGLLEGFRLSNLTNAQLARFHVLGQLHFNYMEYERKVHFD
jgi:IMP and pyridine-specific 5'-nucleotidase